MNRSVLESSSVQQFENPNWWNVNGGLRTQPPLMGHQQAPHMPKNPNLSSLLESNDLPPESWSLSQLLLGGLMMGEEERLEMMNHHNHLDEQLLNHQQASMVGVQIKQESNINNNNGCYVLSSPNSPPNKSCVTTTTTSLNSNEGRHTPPDRSSECNSLDIGGSSNKKPKLQASHSSQSTLKVRKEKLGGRIAALHQLVSPFGKALSHPYFGTTTSEIMMHQQQLQGDGSCIFTDEDSNQVVNRGEAFSLSTDNQNANEEHKKDLRSRGLTLAPVSCILQVDTDNGADYWAPALSSAGFI